MGKDKILLYYDRCVEFEMKKNHEGTQVPSMESTSVVPPATGFFVIRTGHYEVVGHSFPHSVSWNVSLVRIKRRWWKNGKSVVKNIREKLHVILLYLRHIYMQPY